jgi:signal transduction histidine kinase/CheY-like chemotaxis protein
MAELDRSQTAANHPISTVGQLTCHSAAVDVDERTSSVAERFEKEATLPGIIALQSGQVRGLIPRARFLERLSHKFWPELFLPRPVAQVTEVLRTDPLVIGEDRTIADASNLALQRSGDAVFEPLIVRRDDGSFELLDVHTLMVAQTRLLEFFNQRAQSQRVVAEAANESKSNFLANMSHEIRTPLTAIIGFGEELRDPSLTPAQQAEAIDLVVRNGKHLLELVNEILDLSKIEAGRLDVELVPVSVHQIIGDVLAALRIRAKEKQLDLRVNYVTAIPEQITTDPTRVRQILINLLGNALKFTESGSVTVTVRLASALSSPGSEADGALLYVEVTDTGIGISEQDISRLFQPFTQADVTTTRRFGGTGLGLTISRRLAQLLGGDVTVRSDVGVGSTFTVSLATGPLRDVRLLGQPELLQAVSRQAAIPQSEPETLSARILLVDDAPDNRLLVTRILEKHGATVEIAENGRDGADKAWQAFSAGNPFDVVLMDMQMPVLDGFGAARQLRGRGYNRPIVALTANAQPADLQKCYDTGCDAHAPKPIDRAALFRTLKELCDLPGSGAGQLRTEETVGAPLSAKSPAHAAGDRAAFVVDRGTAMRRMGGSEDLVREVAGMVVELLPVWLAEMKRNLDAGDWSNLKRLAHTLKTSAENVGARALAESAWQLESSLQRSENDAASELLQRLSLHATPALSELAEWITESPRSG